MTGNRYSSLAGLIEFDSEQSSKYHAARANASTVNASVRHPIGCAHVGFHGKRARGTVEMASGVGVLGGYMIDINVMGRLRMMSRLLATVIFHGSVTAERDKPNWSAASPAIFYAHEHCAAMNSMASL